MQSDQNQADIYELVIGDLEAKIASLQMTVDNLKNVRGMTSALTAVSAIKPGPVRQEGTSNFGHDAFFGMTIPDAAKKYLAAAKKTVSIPTLVDALLAGGLKSASTNMRENVRSALGRNPEFVRINGEFGLADWYPGKKTQLKKRHIGESSAPIRIAEPSDDDEEVDAILPSELLQLA